MIDIDGIAKKYKIIRTISEIVEEKEEVTGGGYIWKKN